MKKSMAVLLAVLLIAVCFSPLSGQAERSRFDSTVTFVFPSSLQGIDEEAFAGTAAKTAVFQSELRYIGDRAFAGAKRLTDVYIPPETKSIGEGAFWNHKRLTIHGVRGSAAQDWAKEHRVTFVIENIWKNLLNNGGTVVIRQTDAESRWDVTEPDRVLRPAARTVDEGRSMRPQERPELNPIDYRFP